MQRARETVPSRQQKSTRILKSDKLSNSHPKYNCWPSRMRVEEPGEVLKQDEPLATWTCALPIQVLASMALASRQGERGRDFHATRFAFV